MACLIWIFIWILFYAVFLAGWLLHPTHLYYHLDGHYAEWTIISRARWTAFWDFVAIDPFQGMVTLRMPENPWVHLGSLPLLARAQTVVRHAASYTIYWCEFAASTYLLARVIGFSRLAAQVGAQLWLLLSFPPFNTYFGFYAWVMLIPFHVQTIAVGNCLLALFIILGERKPRTNALIAIAALALTFFYYFAAPLRLISVAPGYLFLGICACLFNPSAKTLAWKLGTALGGGLIALGLRVPDYYGALFGHTPRLWEEASLTLGASWGRFDLMDWFFCAMGLFCYSRPLWFSLLYGSLLGGGLLTIIGRWGNIPARPVKVMAIGGAAFYGLMLLIYSLPYIAIWPFGNKFPAPVYVYIPVFPIFCLVVADLWIRLCDYALEAARPWLARLQVRLMGTASLGRTGEVPTTASRQPWATRPRLSVAFLRPYAILALLPILAATLLWDRLGGRAALRALAKGQPVARSTRPAASGTSLVQYLRERIGIVPGNVFRGVAASYLGTVYGPIGRLDDAFTSRYAPTYLETMDYLWREHGNTYTYQDLWEFAIPTLEEYGHFISPGNWRVFIGLLTEAPHYQVISTSRTLRPSVRIMRGLGVHYLISDVTLEDPDLRLIMRQDAIPHGAQRGHPLYLYELRHPNLASYSPTRVTVIRDATETIKRMRQDDFRMEEEVIVGQPLAGPYIPLTSSALYFDKNSLRIVAESQGKSLLLLPVQFSRCWEAWAIPDGPRANVRMLRANLAQTVLEFEGHVQLRLTLGLRFGKRTDCRREDIQDLRAMRILDGHSPWPLPKGKVAYSTSRRE